MDDATQVGDATCSGLASLTRDNAQPAKMTRENLWAGLPTAIERMILAHGPAGVGNILEVCFGTLHCCSVLLARNSANGDFSLFSKPTSSVSNPEPPKRIFLKTCLDSSNSTHGFTFDTLWGLTFNCADCRTRNPVKDESWYPLFASNYILFISPHMVGNAIRLSQDLRRWIATADRDRIQRIALPSSLWASDKFDERGIRLNMDLTHLLSIWTNLREVLLVDEKLVGGPFNDSGVLDVLEFRTPVERPKAMEIRVRQIEKALNQSMSWRVGGPLVVNLVQIMRNGKLCPTRDWS